MSKSRSSNQRPSRNNTTERTDLVQRTTKSHTTDTTPVNLTFNEGLPRSEYLELRKAYIEGEQQSYSNFDNAILTLSSAILGLSVTFVQAFIPNAQYKHILFISWLLLIISLTLTLFSIFVSQSSFRHEINNLDRLYRGEKPTNNKWDGITATLNMLSAIVFPCGIAALVWFGFLNLR